MSRNAAFPPSAADFLLASKRCEITVLQQLLHMGQLVGEVSQLIHMLQRERGTVNIYLCSQGALFGDRLAARRRDVEQAERAVQRLLAQLDATTAPLAVAGRLFSRIAGALQHLTLLPTLRQQAEARRLTPEEAMQHFNAIVHSLLALVYEATDACLEPAMARRLIAMFSFMQGKELAGQERALGAAGFAAGQFDDAAQQRLPQLIDGQERCFHTFVEFADPASLAQWRQLQQQDDREFERLRRMACTRRQPGGDLSLRWFDITSARIDAMKQIEDRLAAALMDGCRASLVAAQRALTQPEPTWPALEPGYTVFVSAPAADGEALLDDGVNPQLGRSLMAMIRQQSQRLQALSEELAATRATLQERREIERAKSLLIQHRGLTEESAYQLLRKMAMDQNKRLIDIARAMLAVADILPGK
ncbi:nitrate regulatory protein [Serratia rubidaea]|uniref:nitrate regulatory protein n=1 Tax=Serratia rubidaea TaxID=61652 RepID=UPI001782914B|nr:nitrate regulatory protein [Serratia rubidaea]MBD8452631.1 nitrate- and nitrite sensing domain-containing protein [Serratia rubidaea]